MRRHAQQNLRDGLSVETLSHDRSVALAHAGMADYYAEADTLTAREAFWVLEGMIRAFARVILPEELRLFDMSRAIIEYAGWDTSAANLVAIVDMAAPLTTAGAERYGFPVGSWIYKEEKTTSASLTDARWAEGWEEDMQLVSGPRCLKAAHDIEIAATIVEGCAKGYTKWEAAEDAAGAASGRRVWHSPYTEGWRNGVGFDGEPLGWAWKRPKAYKGWEFTQTWDAYETPKAFIEAMSLDFLAPHFTQTRPLTIPAYIADEWIEQERLREQDRARLAAGPISLETLRRLAPQNFSSCTRFGSKCEFHALCWSTPPDVSPLDVGFVQREDPWAERLMGDEGEG